MVVKWCVCTFLVNSRMYEFTKEWLFCFYTCLGTSEPMLVYVPSVWEWDIFWKSIEFLSESGPMCNLVIYTQYTDTNAFHLKQHSFIPCPGKLSRHYFMPVQSVLDSVWNLSCLSLVQNCQSISCVPSIWNLCLYVELELYFILHSSHWHTKILI